MEFLGEQRFDSATSVPQYRNVTITRFDAWLYRVVDEFDNAMIRGYVSYCYVSSTLTTSSSILMPADGHFCCAAAREARPTYYRS